MQGPGPTETRETPPAEAAHVLADATTVQTTVFAWRCPSCQAQHSLVHMAQPRDTEALAKGSSLEHACRQCGALLSVARRMIAALPGLGAQAPAPKLVMATR